jgi:hypothetical protein
MTTTDKTREAVPSATQAAWGSQSAVVNPIAAHCAKFDKMYPHPPINSTQTVIVARALNIYGIFNPPVNSVVNNIYHNSGVSTGLEEGLFICMVEASDPWVAASACTFLPYIYITR